ncbi:hypothetical protein [Demetria terragena]|uniref:hypothetical protein n=1 Tax=Demetria terragena TaxID=63959 RepID=UPI00037D4DEF|nr:hypothetical protein [Demetria terragena]
MATASALGATLATGVLTTATALYVGWNPHRRTKQALDLRQSLSGHPDEHLRERWDLHCADLMRRELRRIGLFSRAVRGALLWLGALLAVGAVGAALAFTTPTAPSQDATAALAWLFVLGYFSIITFVLRAGIPTPGAEWEDLRRRALRRAVRRKRAKKWPAGLGRAFLTVEDMLNKSWWRRHWRQRRATQLCDLRIQLRELSGASTPTTASERDKQGSP